MAGCGGSVSSTASKTPASTVTGSKPPAIPANMSGDSWSIMQLGTAIGTGRLADVSCPSPNACIAVAAATDVSAITAYSWNGSSWINISPEGPIGTLSGISCTSFSVCMTAGNNLGQVGANTGYSADPNGVEPLAAEWNGAGWTRTQTANPSGNGTLTDVACTSATTCMAVGYTATAVASPVVPLAEQWNGTTWSITATPEPSGGGKLTGISCASPSACMAVGQNGPAGNSTTFAEQWNGSAWSIVPMPSPTGSSSLTGVSCSSADTCMAVGSVSAACGSCSTPFAEQWNGSAWSTISIPNRGAIGSLASVSCTLANDCMSVGYELSGTAQPGCVSGCGGSRVPLTEHWNGAAWSAVTTPNPGGGGALDGIACTSPDSCMAVGMIGNGASGTGTTSASQPLVEQWGATS